MLAVLLVGVVGVADAFVSSQIESDFEDFDQVETYTRILLHTKNGSILGGPDDDNKDVESLVKKEFFLQWTPFPISLTVQVTLGRFTQFAKYRYSTLRPRYFGPRADSGPLIIDYPFPVHYAPSDYHLHHSSSPEFTRPAANLQQPQYSQISSQYSQLPATETHEKLSSLYHNLGTGLGHHSFLYPHKKKKKKFLKKSGKYLVPLLITLAAKIAHLLPTLKLILLALFSLMLFAKKAFLVSVGTFLLVLYEHFTSKNNSQGSLNLWKDRGQVQTPNQDVHPVYSDVGGGEHKVGSDWWALEGANGTKITPREGEKWRRWWAPQVKGHSQQQQPQPPQLEEAASLRDRIRNNIRRLFGTRDANS